MKIVVATDGSRGGIAAVRFAARLAARDAAAKLILITIVARLKASHKPPFEDTTPAEHILSNAAAMVRSLGVSGRCEVLALQTRQEIPEAISALADRVRADLVVIGSEGRDTLDEWVVGGVALRLIYVARRPVLVVRPSRRRAAVAASGSRTLSPAGREVKSRRSPVHEQLVRNARPHLAKRGSRLRDRLV
jgi:nucleotide-binding universal stress UspA family protein